MVLFLKLWFCLSVSLGFLYKVWGSLPLVCPWCWKMWSSHSGLGLITENPSLTGPQPHRWPLNACQSAAWCEKLLVATGHLGRPGLGRKGGPLRRECFFMRSFLHNSHHWSFCRMSWVLHSWELVKVPQLQSSFSPGLVHLAFHLLLACPVSL